MVLATIYLARETILARLASSEATLREASQKAEKAPDADVSFLLSKVKDLQDKTAAEHS